jgi:uncharacterized membrane protein YqgA involved in biofilm formation
MDIVSFIEQYGIYVYAVVILFGGLIGVNYFPQKWPDKYRFLLFATGFAVLFIVLEVSVSKTFNTKDVIKYLLTYTVVTSAYELFVKALFKKWGVIKDETKSDKDSNG